MTTFSGQSDKAQAGLIMQGGWMRGVNLFGICASAIVLITGFVLLTLCGGAVSLLCRVLDSKGETICRLVYNLIQYLTVFVLLYQVFSYLGFPTRRRSHFFSVSSFSSRITSDRILAPQLRKDDGAGRRSTSENPALSAVRTALSIW